MNEDNPKDKLSTLVRAAKSIDQAWNDDNQDMSLAIEILLDAIDNAEKATAPDILTMNKCENCNGIDSEHCDLCEPETSGPTKEQLFLMYKDAMTVQDACNLSGVVFSFARHMKTLCDMGLDTERKNNHPVSVLFASKIASLTRSNSDEEFSKAYREADKKMAGYMKEIALP